MYKINWTENNLVKLEVSSDKSLNGKPRPVFFEELNLLGFSEYWDYPNSKSPLLWSIDRRYFYNGVEIAEARGGNVYDKPIIKLTEAGKNIKQLSPIDIEALIQINKDALFTLENEALDFIERTFKTYKPNINTFRNKISETKITKKNKVDFVIASFSGGKDSQVVLDLVSRVIPPMHYQVIYSDTDMELPSSINIFNQTKELYQKQYPSLKFYKEKNETPTIEYWKEFGAPSRFHRWCCTVIKTAPFNRLLKKIYGDDKNPRILVFEGVRREESTKRSTYDRIGKGVKHTLITNARPIIDWSITEVWLYIFMRDLPINQSYRNGLLRVGCSVCPFSSNWSEYIIHNTYPEITSQYYSLLLEMTDELGIKEQQKKINYIKEGNWKKRAGGKALKKDNSRVDFITQKEDFIASLTNPKENLLEWLKVIGDVIYDKENNLGEVKIRDKFYKFTLEENKSKKIFKINNVEQDPTFIGKIKRTLYKATYCLHCEACQLECPTGALITSPKVSVNTDLCTHCANCLTFTDKGCLVAKSKHKSEGGSKMKSKRTSGIDKYSSFGLREKWLISFLNNHKNWFEIDNHLGPKQVPAMINWLRDAELLKLEEKLPTQLCDFLVKINNIKLTWEIILVNIYYNSAIFNWFFNNVPWHTAFEKKDLLSLLKEAFDLSEGTLNNPLTAMFNTIEQADTNIVNEIFTIERKGNKRVILKNGSNNISNPAILYSLYKYAEKNQRYNFTVSELYEESANGGAYKVFGISQDVLKNKLRALETNPNQLINVDLIADLDNINLNQDYTSLEILQILINE